jgi:hypothetical protein
MASISLIVRGLTKIKLCTTGGWWFSTTRDGAFEPQENRVARREIAAHPPVILKGAAEAGSEESAPGASAPLITADLRR